MPEPQGLRNARPDRVEPAVARLLGPNPFSITSGSTTVTVTETNHGRSTGDTVVFRNVEGSLGGLAPSVYQSASGFSITVTTTDKYTFYNRINSNYNRGIRRNDSYSRTCNFNTIIWHTL